MASDPYRAPGSMAAAQAMMRYDARKRSVVVTYLIWFFLGIFGVHRFYLGRIVSGLLMLLLNGIAVALYVVAIGYLLHVIPFVWWLIDALLIPGMVTRYNERLAREIL